MDDTQKRRSAIFQAVVSAINARLQEIGPGGMPEVANPRAANRVVCFGQRVWSGGRKVCLSQRSSITVPMRLDVDSETAAAREAERAIDLLVADVRGRAAGPVATGMLPPADPGDDLDMAWLWAGHLPVRLTFTLAPLPRPAFVLTLDACFGPVPAVSA